jgi:hypothetical protein
MDILSIERQFFGSDLRLIAVSFRVSLFAKWERRARRKF